MLIQVKPKLITLSDCDHLDGCGRAFRELPEFVGEAEEALCEGFVPGSSSPVWSGEELQQEESTWSADQGGGLTFAKVTLPTLILARVEAGILTRSLLEQSLTWGAKRGVEVETVCLPEPREKIFVSPLAHLFSAFNFRSLLS